MKKRHRLKLIGITYSQIESGVYAVILEEIDGVRRIPIVIGFPEAQAIECHLQEIKTPRPLTHDMMKNMMESFGLQLKCIDIHKLPTGVFAADLVIENPDGELKKIDSRSSDAISLAIRCNAPIFTTAEVLEEAGFTPKEMLSDNTEEDSQSPSQSVAKSQCRLESFSDLEKFLGDETINEEEKESELIEFLKDYSDPEIEKEIALFAGQEKYEIAAKLKSIITKRN